MTNKIPRLSTRAQENLTEPNVMLDGVRMVNSNKYDAVTNPNGIINLGVAENQLMTKELTEIMGTVDHVNPKLFGYGESPSGSKKLREHFANNIFNRYFNPVEPVSFDQMVLSAGCSATVDNFTFCVCDPGEGIIITAPFYGGFNTDIMAKSKAKVVVCDLGDCSPFDISHVDLMQNALDKAGSEGIKVKAVVLSNPHNPLGRNYASEILIEFLRFASRNQVHILFDEIYALSIFDDKLVGQAKAEQPDSAPFISVLSIPDLEQYCEKDLIHVAYGMSKAMITKLLSDPDTIETFTQTNQKRLAESYTLTVDTLRAHHIPFLPAQGGHFLWADFRQYIPRSLAASAAAGERAAEHLLWRAMLDRGVYVNLGEAFSESKVGFFRLTFAVPVPMLKLGLDRMLHACQGASQEA
ncbi:hypothetical protein BG003_005648 [Podila horticola]|nr:hypothetical protein BG003_005648 [Podila horticola]